MGRLAVVPDSAAAREDFLHHFGVPDNYMGDFSVTGIVVEDYPESLSILQSEGFSIETVGSGSLIGFDGLPAVSRILNLLQAGRIHFYYGDIATLFYQA
jgi:hypothetical protein